MTVRSRQEAPAGLPGCLHLAGFPEGTLRQFEAMHAVSLRSSVTLSFQVRNDCVHLWRIGQLHELGLFPVTGTQIEAFRRTDVPGGSALAHSPGTDKQLRGFKEVALAFHRYS